MSLWNEITNTALIGCERKALSLDGATGDLGVLLSQLDQSDREGSLLSAAAIVSLYNRATTLPMKDAQPLPEACDLDDAPLCGRRAAGHLEMMLRGEYRANLSQWLEKAAEAGLRAPGWLLPQLFELSRMRELEREKISPVLGARGRWLQAQNPAWTSAIDGLDEKLWETGNSEQRRAVLAELRKRDAARGRELLASRWNKESPKNCAVLLGALENGLSLDDEAFLEVALDDRRKDVPRVAADLLAHLPGSALCGRMFERVRPLIAFRLDGLKRKTIEVTSPEACDNAMRRDGVAVMKPFYHSGDEKTWWLGQMLRLIPPEVWSQESGWTISELIEAAKFGGWESVLFEGWLRAALFRQRLEWAGALLDEPYMQDKAQSLFQILPQARQEAFIINLLKADPVLNTSKTAYSYIGSCRRLWSETFSRAVINSLLHTGTLNSLSYHSIWESAKYTVGCRLDPALIPETIARITEATKPPARRAPEVEQFLDFIQFRHEMLKEINQ
jgi:uncharacterized protein DUF5691